MFSIHKISNPTDRPRIPHLFVHDIVEDSRIAEELLGRLRFSLLVKRTRWEFYEGQNGETVVESAVEMQG